MRFTDSIVCRSGLSCAACRSSDKWRELQGAPEICPYGEKPPAPRLNRSGIPIPVLKTAERLAVCARCPKFSEGYCKKCNCPDARKSPAIELNECPIRKWVADKEEGA